MIGIYIIQFWFFVYNSINLHFLFLKIIHRNFEALS